MNAFASGGVQRQSIAVVGSGIAGLSAAWLLARRHRVVLFDQERVGGHCRTVEIAQPDATVPVDTGFMVYNERNYPNFTALLRHLDVATHATDMSFSVSLRRGKLEYSGTNLDGLLAQRSNLLKPRFWQMAQDILRFYREAPGHLDDPRFCALSLGAYLDLERYSAAFVEDHLLPMGAAIWSTSVAQMKSYPARAFIQFFHNHALLETGARPEWRTIAGGSRTYVGKLASSLREPVRLGAVRQVHRSADKVIVRGAHGNEAFDHVVIATHADEALRLLADADTQEQRLLGAWRYTQNRAVLHGDPSLMPVRRRVWSSWNFMEGGRGAAGSGPCVTYWMNRLQPLDTRTPIFVTLNPVHEPDNNTIHADLSYAHPMFDAAAMQSQAALWSLQGRRRTWFCGSYFGAGFHEDALQAGLAVAEQLGGVRRPWNVARESGRITLPQESRAA